MALSSFLNVNVYDFPPPRRGFSWTITTTVNGGRNGDRAGSCIWADEGRYAL